MELPLSYRKQMQDLLGKDYPAYRDSFCTSPKKGLRVNENKITIEAFLSLWEKAVLPPLEKIPWIHNGFFIPDDIDAGKLSLYQAGLYYIQEPAAMTPAEFLPIAAGDRVLDLCAAPGGKSTELLSKLHKSGVLLSNDISQSRAKALKKNLEMAGAENAFVTAETPEHLSRYFREYFDKILIDAPCSGEGMFRTQPQMVHHWEEEGPETYAPIQQEILEYAYQMLAPGGMLMYSTCTFSPLEDEETVIDFLKRHEDVEAVAMPEFEGFSHLENEDGRPYPFIRLYPHKIRGEGQFAALLQKKGNAVSHAPSKASSWSRQNEHYRLPDVSAFIPSLHYLMTGLHIGTEKNGRLSLSQAYAMTLQSEKWPDCLNLTVDDVRVEKYLRGETIALTDAEMQAKPSSALPASLPKIKDQKKEKAIDTLVLLEGYPLGFGRRNRNMLKNKRAQGWRWM